MYAVILAGGGGTRLWPLSRPERPKPFLPLLAGETLLRRTVDRLAPLIGIDDVFVVTDARYADIVRELLPELGPDALVAEPTGRNTAAAIALATLAIDRSDDDMMVVLPADHAIADAARFRAILAAVPALAGRDASGGALYALGIRPSGPETGYGYVVPGASVGLAGGVEAFTVRRFVEKPDAETARALLAGDPPAAWNGGIFAWRRSAIRDALARHAPDILATVGSGLEAAAAGEPGVLAEAYDAVRRTSIDYAVMEPAAAAGDVRVLPADIGWSDLGSWAAIRDALVDEAAAAGGAAAGRATGSDGAGAAVGPAGDPADAPGTVGWGPRRDVGSSGTLVVADRRLVVTIGLRDTIVVDTPDAVLVCAADRSQEVRSIAEELARRAVEEGS
jgi:mannose-1-phosphate guanylyltransferase